MANFYKILTSELPELIVGRHVYSTPMLGISTYTLDIHIGFDEIVGKMTVEKVTLPSYAVRFQEVYKPCGDAVCLLLDSKSPQDFIAQIFAMKRYSWFNHAWYETMNGVPEYGSDLWFLDFDSLQASYPEFVAIFLEAVNEWH